MNSIDGIISSFAVLGYAAFVMPIALVGLIYPYLALRLRPVPTDQQDPQIGLKCALYFIYSLGILMFLAGASVLVVDLMIRGEWFVESMKRLEKLDNTHRTAYALMTSGALFTFFHLLLILGYTNNRQFPEVRRVWVGWRFAIHSLIVLLCVTMLIFVVFMENSSERDMQFPLALLIVWGPSWFLHLILLKAYRGSGSPPVTSTRKPRKDDDDEDEGERPVRPVQPQRPTTSGPSQQQQQQQRPAQGQGPAQRPASGGQPAPRPTTGPQRIAPRKPIDD